MEVPWCATYRLPDCKREQCADWPWWDADSAVSGPHMNYTHSAVTLQRTVTVLVVLLLYYYYRLHGSLSFCRTNAVSLM